MPAPLISNQLRSKPDISQRYHVWVSGFKPKREGWGLRPGRTGSALARSDSSHAGKANSDVPLFQQTTTRVFFLFLWETNNHRAWETCPCTTINRHWGTMDSVVGRDGPHKMEQQWDSIVVFIVCVCVCLCACARQGHSLLALSYSQSSLRTQKEMWPYADISLTISQYQILPEVSSWKWPSGDDPWGLWLLITYSACLKYPCCPGH